MNEEEKTIVKKAPPQFIPELIGKKVMIHLVSGGQPITGTIKAYDPYESCFRQQKEISWFSSGQLAYRLKAMG